MTGRYTELGNGFLPSLSTGSLSWQFSPVSITAEENQIVIPAGGKIISEQSAGNNPSALHLPVKGRGNHNDASTPPTAAHLLISLQEEQLLRRAKRNMLANQLAAEGITETRLLDAFRYVPRELFLPEYLEGLAYMEEDLPLIGHKLIGHKRFLHRPSSAAKLLQAAEITQDMQVLIVPGGNGYLTALTARLAKQVVMVEEEKELLIAARNAFQVLQLGGITLVKDTPLNGYEASASYERILVGSAVEEVPLTLLQQLSSNGKLYAVKENSKNPGQKNRGRLCEYGHAGDNQFYEKKLFDLCLQKLECGQNSLADIPVEKV